MAVVEITRRSFLAATFGVVMFGAGTSAHAGESTAESCAAAVTGWVARHATPLDTVEPADPLDDVAALSGSIGDATIVGLGESAHGAAEELTLKHRILRLLVEEQGFRSIAWEEDWSVGRAIDDYIRGGDGDLDELVGQMSAQWHATEVANVLRWLRDYNTGRTDQVQFVGVEYYLTGQSAYDAIEDHVATRAPEHLAELREHLQLVRPTTPDIFEHIQWNMSVSDKQPWRSGST